MKYSILAAFILGLLVGGASTFFFSNEKKDTHEQYLISASRYGVWIMDKRAGKVMVCEHNFSSSSGNIKSMADCSPAIKLDFDSYTSARANMFDDLIPKK